MDGVIQVRQHDSSQGDQPLRIGLGGFKAFGEKIKVSEAITGSMNTAR